MGVMAPLLTKLAKLLGNKCYKLKGVRKDIEFFRCELAEMNVVLEKLADMERLDGQQKLWRDNVREMRMISRTALMCSCIILDGLLQKTARKIRKLRVQYQIANKIQQLKARVMEVAERRSRYIGLGEATTSSPKVVEIDPRLPALYEAAKNLVGIDGSREESARWLMEEGENNGSTQQLRGVSVVGFGGLGKTTLANQVYNQIKDQFDCTSFLSVSKNPNMLKLLKNLLLEVHKKKKDDNQKLIDTLRVHKIPDDNQKLIDTLREHLANKRYLIVIDDIWSTKIWNIIQCAFVQNNYGSRVIITTRIEDVATKCSFDFHGMVYKMQPLDEVNSRHGMNVERWEKVQNYLGYELETNPILEWMRHVLNLSYSDLPHDLRACFLYLGIYPEDSKIFKVDLTRLWIAEGFVEEKAGLDLEEAAGSYFNELINRSLIEPNNYYLGECQEENFITVATKQSILNDRGFPVRRLCCQLSYENLEMERMEVSQVRSFITSRTQPPISKFEHLRVLKLVAYVAPTLLDLSAVSNLFLLRHLRIRGFQVIMPQKIGRLQCLRTLDLLCSLLVTGIPSDVISLSSLRHLTVSDVLQLPNWIG
uniref:NB-ARC domain-containing protein n=1 Tax=Oryza barthii TaxID=65489 RepID=A0A0D3HUC2_9ORYZ